MASNTVRGNHSFVSCFGKSLGSDDFPQSPYLCDMSFSFLSPATFSLFISLSSCPLLWQLFGGGEGVMCVCVCACTHTRPWLKNMARTVCIGANEQQYPSRCDRDEEMQSSECPAMV